MRALAIVVLLCSQAFADPGVAGNSSSKILMSPRAVGMGESGVGLSNDLLTAVSLNPAGLARLNYVQAAVTYNQLYEGFTMQHGAFVLPTADYGAFALSGTMFHSNPIAGFDNLGARSNDVNVQDFSVSSHYARRLAGPSKDPSMGLFGGAGATFARSTLETVSASSFLLDLGVLGVTRFGPGIASAGFSATSLGQGPRYDVQRELPPTVYRGGLAYSWLVLGDPFSMAWDAKKASDQKLTYNLGLEYALKRIVFWRLGYASDQDMGSGFRFGVGFKIKLFTVDYALSHGGNFGLTHLVGFSMKFGEPLDATPVLTAEESEAILHVKRGNALMRSGRDYDAALEFNEALRLDPHNKEALQNLRRVREVMEGRH